MDNLWWLTKGNYKLIILTPFDDGPKVYDNKLIILTAKVNKYIYLLCLAAPLTIIKGKNKLITRTLFDDIDQR